MTAGTDGRVLIVGTGQAGVQTAVSLRQLAFDGPVTLVGAEPGLPYQRPPLSKGFLTGAGEQALLLRTERFYADQGIDLLPGERVVSVDRGHRRVRLASGGELDFAHLVLALGAHNRSLRLPGAAVDGVLSLRTLADAIQLRERLAAAQNAVIIGGGFIGLEIAAAARKVGVHTVVIEAAARAMGRSVSLPTSRFLTGMHRREGTRVLLHTTVERIIGCGGRVAGVQTDDGTRLPADLVIIGVGVEPTVDLAESMGLRVANGIVVDDHLTTADPAVSAIGDCACFPGRHTGDLIRLESVQNAVDQGRCVAARIAGKVEPYRAVPWFWSEQGTAKLQIAGVTSGHDSTVVRGDPGTGRFSVFCFRGERLLGVESVNRTADHLAARRLLAAGAAVSAEQAADQDFSLKAVVAAG